MSSGILIVIKPGKKPNEVSWNLPTSGRGPPLELVLALMKAPYVIQLFDYLGIKRRMYMYDLDGGPRLEGSRLNEQVKLLVPSIPWPVRGILIIDIPTTLNREEEDAQTQGYSEIAFNNLDK
jgi:hypothetical protein